MKLLFLGLIFINLLVLDVACASAPHPVGLWQFSSYIYREKELPLPNPDLIMQFEFLPEGKNRLFYRHKGEVTFCERLAEYSFDEEEHLFQKVVWVNPSNGPQCGSDTDMHLGRETINHAYFQENRFFLDVSLSEEYLTFIWTKVDSSP